MTGLFNSLSERFSHRGAPAIRPRPQARFEGTSGDDGLVEDTLITQAPSPQTPRRAPVGPAAVVTPAAPAAIPTHDAASAVVPASPPVAPDPAGEPVARADNAQSVKPSRPKGRHKPIKETAPAKTVIKAVSDVPPKRVQTPHAAPDQPVQTLPDQPVAQVPLQENARANVTPVIATPVATTASRPVVTAPAAPVREPEPAPVTVHIGRVEVRATKPAPLAPTPPRAHSVANSARVAAQKGPGGSRLTSYLGWKT